MSNGDVDEHEECTLCLLPLKSYDNSHPLQCPSRHCDFNCCLACIEAMIKSAKDGPTEASDGNKFRIFLHCPNCRNSHMGISIRDTLLLRKVDKYSRHGIEATDERLTASELRFKHALARDEDVALAVEEARHREDEFFGWEDEVDAESANGTHSLRQSSEKQSFSLSFDDEEGFEVYEDESGFHKSFIVRYHSMEAEEPDLEPDFEDIEADSTLLCGLDTYMTDIEQKFMTAQLVSGSTTRIAAATEMMHFVSALSRQGIKPNLKRQRSSMSASLNSRRSVLASIKEVIREGAEARQLEEDKKGYNPSHAKPQLNPGTRPIQFGTPVTGGQRNIHMNRQAAIKTKRQMEYMKIHPLPLRMPKYAEITAKKNNSSRFAFLNDTWDGSILDAYSKIIVTKSFPMGHITVTKKHAENPGVRRVIDAGTPKSSRTDRLGIIDTEKPRVIITSINREFGQQGIVKGDVVSHFNGEPFMGTASELMGLILSQKEGENLTFVFNGDDAVAEALKRRSMLK